MAQPLVMSLHRKQRGIVGDTSRYMRIPSSRACNLSMNYSLGETRVHAQRVYTKRYAEVDRSRKISSLQLRTCFLLCVLLYFCAIYFADDIASIGRAVGSEQNSQSFFVHSLRPRGAGNVRVGRAITVKKVEDAKTASKATERAKEQHNQQQYIELDNPSAQSPSVEQHDPNAEIVTTKMEKMQAMKPPKEPNIETTTVHPNRANVRSNVLENVIQSEPQSVGAPVKIEDAMIADREENILAAEKQGLIAASRVNLSDEYEEAQYRVSGGSNTFLTSKKQTGREQPEPIPEQWHPDKARDVDDAPAVQPARMEKHSS